MAIAAPETRVFGHYRLLEKIGSGGMGEVYRAHDDHLDRDVAIKILPLDTPPGRLFDSKARRALRHEALTLSRLSHPNIAQIYDLDKEGETDFIVMEFVPGESLARKLARGPLPLQELLSFAGQILEGLRAAHAQGIIHRDLKPANLQITADGRVKILDFGLAQIVHPSDFDLDTATTQAGTEGISGTLPYLSPEQLHGAPSDARSDIWSFGVVLYEMAAGRLPFQGKTTTGVADAILHQPAPPVGDGDNATLESVIHRCLAKDVSQRYQTAEEVLEEMRRYASGDRMAEMSEAPPWRKRTVAISALMLAVLLVATVLAGYLRWKSKPVSDTITSVAVLPLANLSADPSQEYFSDGMTDAIISELARAGSLKVISRTSVMRYKNAGKPVSEIARELHVDGIIEGSVLREGNRVRINAQLIHAPTEKQVWADSFERDERDVLSLQDEIAHAISRQLRVRLGGKNNPVSPSSVDPEAYDALLKARFYTYRLTAADNARAEQFAREAIGRQPDLGPAHHILAEILWYQAIVLGNPTVTESRNLLQESLQAARKAIALGTNAHSTYALLLFNTGSDLVTVENEYIKGIELQPNLSSVHGHYGVFLTLIGRCSEGRGELLRAVELDPTSEFALTIAGEFLFYCRDLQSGERFALAALNLDPRYQPARNLAEAVYLAGHRASEFLALVDRSARSDSEKAEIHRVFATGGEAGFKRWVLQRVLNDPLRNQRAINLAYAYALAGEKEHTLEYLWKAYEQQDPRLEWVRAFPQFRFLYGDPEFNALLKKIGLPETTK